MIFSALVLCTQVNMFVMLLWVYIHNGEPADLDPLQNGPPGPNPLANMDRVVHIR
jgi:hypothetical protein